MKEFTQKLHFNQPIVTNVLFKGIPRENIFSVDNDMGILILGEWAKLFYFLVKSEASIK